MDGVAATRADMVEFSGVFDSWASWLSTQLHSHASQHANFVSESTEEVASLRAKQQQLTLAQQHNSRGTGHHSHSPRIARSISTTCAYEPPPLAD